MPYILKEAGSGEYGSDLNTILKKIDNEERGCRDVLIRTSSNGIIGGTIPNSWVLRTPLDIYWNGIKRLGIFKEDLSVKEYLLQSMLQRSNKNKRGYGNRESTEEHNRDDYDAGDLTTFQFWSLGNTYQRNWRNGLTIELLPQEASFLRNQVIVNQRNTLFAYVLGNRFMV